MADKSKPTRVVTGEVRFSYVHVFEAYTSDPEDYDPKYSLTILIPKKDKATLAKIEAAIEAAKQEDKGKWGGKIPASLNTTLHDGDEEADLERNPEYAGHMYMAIASNQRPGVVDEDRNPILDQSQVYSGCYGRVSMNAFGYNTKGNKGVSFGLGNVQFLRDGEPLGGRTRAEDDFADDEDLL